LDDRIFTSAPLPARSLRASQFPSSAGDDHDRVTTPHTPN
jgi:hypothetical protein